MAISPTFFPLYPPLWSLLGLYSAFRSIAFNLGGNLHKIKLDIVPKLASEINEKVVAESNSSQRGDLSGVFFSWGSGRL